MKCIFIYNPYSGNGRVAKKLDYIVKRLKTKYDTVDVYATKSKDDMSKKVREVADDYDLIVFSGGDGSFNDILHGVGDREKLPSLAYIPGGTTNDIAHSLGISRQNVRKAVNVVLKGRTEMLDCMRINDKEYAMYVVAAGAFTSATYSTPQKEKRDFGMLAYGKYGLVNNLKFKVFPATIVTYDANISSSSVLMLFMNGKSVAGINLNNHGSMQDGVIECAMVKQKKKPNLLHKILGLFSVVKLFLFGYSFKEKNLVHIDSGKFKVIVGEDVVWNYDGEEGTRGPIEIECLKNKVPLIVPKKRKNI